MNFFRRRGRIARLWLLLGVGAAAFACAIAIKQAVSDVHLAAHGALVILDKAEDDLCRPDPAKVNHCTSAAMTDSAHQAISQLIIDAATLDKEAAQAIIEWDTTQPMPKNLTGLLEKAGEIFANVRALAPSLEAKAQAFLDKVIALVKRYVSGS